MSPESHPNVGSHLFEYRFDREGSSTRYGFNIRVGDDPNWPGAMKLMPGAVLMGKLYAVFEAHETDDGAVISHANDGHWYDCELHVKDSVFRTSIWALSGAEAYARVKAIGGLRLVGGRGFDIADWMVEPQAGTKERLSLFLRWHWLRRPTIRRRSPLDIFDHGR